MTLGSLFDGSGTCPLAATLMGIKPVWASEIEPYPIAVTKKNFPEMLHLGSITDINGGEIPPVDIITGGSPCQDLSVAGKRKGLEDGERSHLFYEMTRVIKEMRDKTNGKYPRFILWENVPGALSSGTPKGGDFLAVVQNFAQIADPFVHVPEPEIKGGKYRWKNSGYLEGDTWSIAWRIMDAQWWGVPQRRRRLFLVMDLGRVSDVRGSDGALRHTGGFSAGKILFERKGLCGYPPTGFREGQGAARNTEESAGAEGCG